MTHIIFTFLCGCIYLIGMLFGWSYQDASVYICIYACPVVCVICAFLSLLNCTTKSFWGVWRLSLNLALFTTYLFATNAFWEHYCFGINPMGYECGDFVNAFDFCVKDITDIANDMHISYEACNLLIYCGLFGSVVAFHLIQLILFKDNKLFFNRPWFRKRFIKKGQPSVKY